MEVGRVKKSGRFYRLSQEQWGQIKDCSHRRKGRKGFAPKVSNRKVFEAVLYRERTGCPWRDVPAFYGFWHTIYMRWQRRVEAGVPQKAMIVRYLEAVETGELDQGLALLDSSIVRAHQHAAGARQKRRAASPWTQPWGPEYQAPTPWLSTSGKSAA